MQFKIEGGDLDYTVTVNVERQGGVWGVTLSLFGKTTPALAVAGAGAVEAAHTALAVLDLPHHAAALARQYNL